MVSVQARGGGWLRHDRMGRNVAVYERKSGDVRRFICRRDTNAGSADEAAASCGDLSNGDGFELSRELDVSGRRVRTVVQPIVDFRTGGKYGNAAVERIEDRDRWHEDSAADGISGDEGGCEWAGALLSGLAGASQFRRVLETVVD